MVESSVEPAFSSASVANDLEPERPVRVSGFIALLLGLLSSFTIFTTALLVLPLLALATALVALRPCSQGRPVGRTPAMIGAILAIFFASWGWLQASTRDQALQARATQFAQDWLLTVQQGHTELAVELASPPSLRQSERMPLEPFYQENETAQQGLAEFLDRPLVQDLIAGGPSLRWELSEPPIIRQRRDAERVTVRFREVSGIIGDVVQIDMRREAPDAGEGGEIEWTVENFQYFFDR